MLIFSKRNSERGSAHAFLALMVVVGLVGVLGFLGYNAWQKQSANAGNTSTLGKAVAADRVFYNMISKGSYTDPEYGPHQLKLSGKDTVLVNDGMSSHNWDDVSGDGLWLLSTSSDGAITAYPTSGDQPVSYPVSSTPLVPNCSYGTSTITNIAARFAGPSNGTKPPTVVYSLTTRACKNKQQSLPSSSSVQTLNQDGTNKDRFLKSSKKGRSFDVIDSANGTVLIAQYSNEFNVTDLITYSKSRNLVSSTGGKGWGVLSGDGKKVVYQPNYDTNIVSNINGSGKKSVKIKSNIANDISLSFSGKFLSYVESKGTTDTLITINVANGETKRVTTIHKLKKNTVPSGSAYTWVGDNQLVHEYIDYAQKKMSIKLTNANNSTSKTLTTLNFGNTSFIKFL